MRYKYEDSPDALFDGDLVYGIPNLLYTKRADFIDLPVLQWGRSNSRRYDGSCSVQFYTGDDRYSFLWSRPQNLLNTGVVTVVEPNFSLGESTPPAVAIWRTYQKRWLTRYWQENGVRVLVDLSVPTIYQGLNMVGVPKDWNAFAYRGYNGHSLDDLEVTYRYAKSYCGDNKLLFLVYGGGYGYRTWCVEHNCIWIPEESKVRDAKRKHTDYQLAKSVNLDKYGVVNRGR